MKEISLFLALKVDLDEGKDREGPPSNKIIKERMGDSTWNRT